MAHSARRHWARPGEHAGFVQLQPNAAGNAGAVVGTVAVGDLAEAQLSVPAVAAKHPRTCPGTIPADGGDYFYLHYSELRHDSRQWHIRPHESSRQHESRLLIRVADDSHWMGRDTGTGYGTGVSGT